MARWLLQVAYDGQDFYGWQWQKSLPTVQGYLNEAVSRVANEAVSLTVCGRTDRGVHAVGQCVHFDSLAERSPEQWQMGIHTHLPPSIRVMAVHRVSDAFHVRFDASARLYRYCIEVGTAPTPTLSHAVWFLRNHLDVEAMQRAVRPCLGEHDFSAFRGPDCQSKTAMRHLLDCQIDVIGGRFYIISVKANAFLHHMVRLWVGALVQVGVGRKPEAWLAALLAGGVRAPDVAMAPASGLYFWQAFYPDDKLNGIDLRPDGGWVALLER